jgi:hypothetical protein
MDKKVIPIAELIALMRSDLCKAVANHIAELTARETDSPRGCLSYANTMDAMMLWREALLGDVPKAPVIKREPGMAEILAEQEAA